ncbi:hypothetical protein KL941_005437, partial [Ogataea angusta]
MDDGHNAKKYRNHTRDNVQVPPWGRSELAFVGIEYAIRDPSIVPNPRNPSHSVYTAHLIPLTGH